MRIGDSDGSFLDKASDLINAGLHVVNRAMKNIAAGFFNIGNSIAAGVTGVAASIAGGVSGFVGNLAHACYKIVVITSLTMMSACSLDYTLQKPVEISGNCDREAITAALDGNWHKQSLSLVELLNPPPPNESYSEMIEEKQMYILLHDFVKELNNFEQCYSIANHTHIPSDSSYNTIQGQTEFLIRQDQSVCVRPGSKGGKLYCSQTNIGENK